MSQNENLLDVVVLLYKWRKYILGAGFITAVVAAICSLMLPNFYKAHTLFYSASPDLAQPMPVGNSNEKEFIYGGDSDLDRLFSISHSNTLTNYLTEKYDLYTHYGINPDGDKARHKLSLKLNKLYKTTKTKYDAIDLSIEDKDPKFAAILANAARDKINDLAQDVIKESFRKKIMSYESALTNKKKSYSTLMDSLNIMRTRYGIFSSDSQGESYGSMLIEVEGDYLNAAAQLDILKNSSNVPRDSLRKVQAKKTGLEKQLEKLKADISDFNTGFPVVKDLERTTRDQSALMNLDMVRLTSLKNAYDAEITALHVIEKAETPDYKSRPRRSIVVVMAALIATILMSLWVILRDQYRKQDWSKALRDD